MNDTPYYKKEVLPTKSDLKTESKNYAVPKVELSENIQNFDRKVKVHTTNPYSANTVSKGKTEVPLSAIQTASQMIANPLYNEAGKVLGVDTLHEWGLYYDKVHDIVEMAKQRIKSEDPQALSEYIYKQLNSSPSLGNKRIIDVYTYLKMGGHTPEPRTKVVTKTVIKKVYVKPKENTEQFVNNWMKGVLNAS